jgi:hypothetical protein
VPLRHAAAHAGIGQSTLWQTLQRGAEAIEAEADGETLNDDDVVCAAFFRAKEEARAAVAVRNMALMQRGAQGGQLIRKFTHPNGLVEEQYAPIDWRAADTILKRTFPKEFAESQAMEVTGANGGPVQVQGSASADGLRELAASVRASIQASHDGDGEIVDAEVVDEGQASIER